jgi:predicted MPP superfamily phosphohydrolase
LSCRNMAFAMTPTPPSSVTISEPLTRRRFLRRAASGAALAATGTFLYTWRVEPHWVEVVHQPLPIERLPTEMVGKRVIQVSDLHAGPIVDRQFLISSLEGIAELKPDAIVLTGDFMSCDGSEEVGEALDVLRALPTAPLGRMAIMGNHDYGQGWIQDNVANKLCDGLASLDIQPLRNEVASAGTLQIAGIDELWAGSRFQPERALRDLNSDGAALALCHNPDAVDLPDWGDFRGWILAGHTHGGQCKPPFLPPPLTPVKNKRYVAGAYDVGHGRQLYINRGLGYLMRVRFNARPEITLFTLQRA